MAVEFSLVLVVVELGDGSWRDCCQFAPTPCGQQGSCQVVGEWHGLRAYSYIMDRLISDRSLICVLLMFTLCQCGDIDRSRVWTHRLQLSITQVKSDTHADLIQVGPYRLHTYIIQTTGCLTRNLTSC